MNLEKLPPISTAETFNEESKKRDWGYELLAINEPPYRWELVDKDGQRQLCSGAESDALVWALAIAKSENRC